MSAVMLRKRSDGVATLWFDTPGSPVNVLSRELLGEIVPLLDEVEGDPDVRACVLASSKRGTFIAGADLEQIAAFETPEAGERFSRNGHAVLLRLAGGAKPFVAAIWGPALGGGLEIALACRYRIAVDAPETVLGLPEVTLGLLPGGGGTQRLPRLIGLSESLPLLLTGKKVRAGAAHRLGLVDQLVAADGLEEAAAAAAAGLADGTLDSRRFIETAAGRSMLLRKARAEVQSRTRGLYPAPVRILECVATGYDSGIEAGFDKEAVLFGHLAAGPEAKRLLGLFQDTRALRKAGAAAKADTVRRLAVVGGGFMGSGIAAVSIPHVDTWVKDLSVDVLASCVSSVRKGLESRRRAGAITGADFDRQSARLKTTTLTAELSDADLVVEAVFEDLDLKRRVLSEIESVVSPAAVFASNTSALPIASIAEGARHPERVLGMHYFSPVPRMPLLEIVVGVATSEQALATARAFGIRQGKTVIVVRDGPGFYTSRILSPYLNEAVILLAEGARVEDIDRSVRNFGFPVGPLALLDEVGIDVAAHVTRQFGDLYRERGMGESDGLVRLHDAGFEGRKNGRGFYRYDEARRGNRKRDKRVNEAVYELFGGARRGTIDRDAAGERCAMLMVNEAVHALRDDIVACPRDGDVGAILGLGFPAVRGGPFRYVDALGARSVVDALERLEGLHGPRFEPAPLLRDMAGHGRTFYPA